MVGILYLPKEAGCSNDPIGKTETSDSCIVISSLSKPGLSYPEFHLMPDMTSMNRRHDHIRFRWAHCLLHAVQLYAAQRVRTQHIPRTATCLDFPNLSVDPTVSYCGTLFMVPIVVSAGIRSFKLRIIHRFGAMTSAPHYHFSISKSSRNLPPKRHRPGKSALSWHGFSPL